MYRLGIATRQLLATLRYLMAAAIALSIFVGWVYLVGPQIHVVEAIIGLLVAGMSSGYFLFRTRRKKPGAKQS